MLARASLAIRNFTLQDVVGLIAGVLSFLPFLLAPGYVAGYGLNLVRFRLASWRERLLLAVTLSVALTPITATLLGRVLPFGIVCWIFAAVAGIAALLILRNFRSRHATPAWSRETRIGLSIIAIWIALAIISLVDLQVGQHLYLPTQAFDQGIRSALTGGAARTGVPPANPFFYPGRFITLRYYYYWNVLCAMPARLFGLSPRFAALSGVIWSGFALAALVPLYLKHFCEETTDLARKSIIGIALLAVTGLDIIPTIMVFLAQRDVLGDMEWWDSTQVASWIDSLLWVPHHIAGLIACLTGFLVLWVVPREAPRSERLKAAVVAALAFATAAGFSVYVTFTFAIFLITWTLVLLRSSLFAEALMFLATGVLTVLVSLPYLHELQAPGWNGAFAVFYVRALESLADWADAHIQADWLQNLLLVALLPVYYMIELGVFSVTAFATVRNFWRRRDPLRKWEWASLSIAGASLLVGTFLESTSGNNDLGYRSVLIAQFILLLWAVPYVYRWRIGKFDREGRWRILFHTFLWLGVLGTAYQLVELRVFTILADRQVYVDDVPWLPAPDTMSEDVYDIRAGFQAINQHLPHDAILQYGPTNPAYVPNVYYLRRQTVDGIPNCGTPFGGDPFVCLQYQYKLLEAFNGRKPFTMAQANQLCSDLHIDLLVAERSDRMWALKQSWVWSDSAVVESEYLRAIPCGARRETIAHDFQSP